MSLGFFLSTSGCFVFHLFLFILFLNILSWTNNPLHCWPDNLFCHTTVLITNYFCKRCSTVQDSWIWNSEHNGNIKFYLVGETRLLTLAPWCRETPIAWKTSEAIWALDVVPAQLAAGSVGPHLTVLAVTIVRVTFAAAVVTRTEYTSSKWSASHNLTSITCVRNVSVQIYNYRLNCSHRIFS